MSDIMREIFVKNLRYLMEKKKHHPGGYLPRTGCVIRYCFGLVHREEVSTRGRYAASR